MWCIDVHCFFWKKSQYIIYESRYVVLGFLSQCLYVMDVDKSQVLTSHIIERACHQHRESQTKWHHFLIKVIFSSFPFFGLDIFSLHFLHFGFQCILFLLSSLSYFHGTEMKRQTLKGQKCQKSPNIAGQAGERWKRDREGAGRNGSGSHRERTRVHKEPGA